MQVRKIFIVGSFNLIKFFPELGVEGVVLCIEDGEVVEAFVEDVKLICFEHLLFMKAESF